MNALSREDAVNLGKSINLPDLVLCIVEDKIPNSIINYFSTPIIFELNSEEQKEYGFGKVLPLWSSTNGDIIFAYDFSSEDYFSFTWDGDVKARFATWDDLIKENVSRVMDIIWDDQSEGEVLDALKEIFDRFEIENIDALFLSILDQEM